MNGDQKTKKFLSIYTAYDALKYILTCGIDDDVVEKDLLGLNQKRMLSYPIQEIRRQLEQDIKWSTIQPQKTGSMRIQRSICDPADPLGNCVYSYYGMTANQEEAGQIRGFIRCFENIIQDRTYPFEPVKKGKIRAVIAALLPESAGNRKETGNFLRLCFERNVFGLTEKTGALDIVLEPNRLPELAACVGDPKRLTGMITFFSDFTLLSPLGYFLRQRFTDQPEQRSIVVTNNSLYTGLSGESVFRVLKAIHSQAEIRFDNEKKVLLTPLKIYYNGDRQPWLYALDNGVLVERPLNTGIAIGIEEPSQASLCSRAIYLNRLLTIDGRKGCRPLSLSADHKSLMMERDGEMETVKLTRSRKIAWEEQGDRPPLNLTKVDHPLHYHDLHVLIGENKVTHRNNRYLIKRIQKETRLFSWQQASRGKTWTVVSPFEGTMECVDYCFEVATQEENWYWDWVRSFGEFAYCEGQPGEETERDWYENANKKKPVQVDLHNSLLNPYNSKEFVARVKDREALPPTNLEIDWLDYVLKAYPQLAQCFLSPTEYRDLREKTADYRMASGRDAFQRQAFNPFAMPEAIRFPCRDIEVGPSSDDVRFVLKAIGQNQIWDYHFLIADRWVHQRTMPYAIKYHAERHEFRIMAYSLTEKRLIAINLDRNFRAEHYDDPTLGTGEHQQHFPEVPVLDRIYFKCAEIIRRVAQNQPYKEDGVLLRLKAKAPAFRVNGRNKNLVMLLGWLEHHLTDREAVRQTLQQEYTRLETVTKEWDPAFAPRGFGYKTAPASRNALSVKEDKNTALVLTLMNVYLNCFKNDDGIIQEDAADLIKGAIVYEANVLMVKRLQFVPRVPLSCRLVDQINQEFEDYNCILANEDGRLTFTLTYARYDDRKVQKGLMLLRDRIQVVGPQAAVAVFDQRCREVKRLKAERE